MAEAVWAEAVRRALEEDRAREDVTTRLLDAGRRGEAAFVAEQPLVVCGVPAVLAAVHELDAAAGLAAHAEEGQSVQTGARIAVVRGAVAALLSAERVALNFLQRLCGIATATRQAVDALAGTRAKITHTRKTTPGLRALEIAAVVAGGGVPNRASLADAVMWKDNHWAMLDAGGGSLAGALRQVPPGLEVVVEVESWSQLDAALAAGARHLLVDNQAPGVFSEFVRRAGAGVTIQASGGITPQTARAYAEAGADLIAIGSLTHSAPAASIRCDIFPL